MIECLLNCKRILQRYVVMLLAMSTFACSSESGDNSASRDTTEELKDGTMLNNEHRAIVNYYFERLRKTGDTATEREVVTQFAGWLNQHNYKLQIETNDDGSHNLACPHMPTVTPWTDYTFKNPDNINRLPQHNLGRD